MAMAPHNGHAVPYAKPAAPAATEMFIVMFIQAGSPRGQTNHLTMFQPRRS
jgi:hypothetical protein